MVVISGACSSRTSLLSAGHRLGLGLLRHRRSRASRVTGQRRGRQQRQLGPRLQGVADVLPRGGRVVGVQLLRGCGREGRLGASNRPACMCTAMHPQATSSSQPNDRKQSQHRTLTICEKEGRAEGSWSRQRAHSCSRKGSAPSSGGGARLRRAKPTAPTTCMAFRFDHGASPVSSSHRTTPYEYTSAASSYFSQRSTSGAIHSGVPPALPDDT